MLQIIKELGNMKGHSDVEIIELEELGRVSLKVSLLLVGSKGTFFGREKIYGY